MTQSNAIPENDFSEIEIITLALADAYGEINHIVEEKLNDIHYINEDNKEQDYANIYQEHFEIGLQKIHSILKEHFYPYCLQAEEILTSKC